MYEWDYFTIAFKIGSCIKEIEKIESKNYNYIKSNKSYIKDIVTYPLEITRNFKKVLTSGNKHNEHELKIYSNFFPSPTNKEELETRKKESKLVSKLIKTLEKLSDGKRVSKRKLSDTKSFLRTISKKGYFLQDYVNHNNTSYSLQN